MAQMGNYCKAYPVSRFREFNGWQEKQAVKESEGEAYLFLQENFIVTDGVFLDEDIVFDDVTPEWKDFCTAKLQFAIPEDVLLANDASK